MYDVIISIFSGKIGSLFNNAWTRIKYYWNTKLTSTVPYSKDEALKYAYGILSGNISDIWSFRNFSDKRVYLLVKVKEKKDDFFEKLVLLRKVGNSFTREWDYELIIFTENIEVRDLLKKGVHYILFIENSFGSGAGTKILYVLNSQTKELIEVIEHHDWSDLTRAYSPTIEFNPQDIDLKLLDKIERIALSRGMLSSKIPDFTKPEHAIQNWHRMNGTIREGDVELYFYPGKPVYGSSLEESVSTTDIDWIAYFKGPLCGYLKEEDVHFIAYSPGWTYDWPRNLKLKGTRVSFTTGNYKLTFEFLGEKGKLY